MIDENIKLILPHKRKIPKYNNYDLYTEEIEELKAAFNVFKENNNEKIKPINITNIFKKLGYDKDNKSIMNLLDYLTTVSDNDLVTFEQFLDGCTKYLGKYSEEDDLRTIYELFVESRDNVI